MCGPAYTLEAKSSSQCGMCCSLARTDQSPRLHSHRGVQRSIRNLRTTSALVEFDDNLGTNFHCPVQAADFYLLREAFFFVAFVDGPATDQMALRLDEGCLSVLRAQEMETESALR